MRERTFEWRTLLLAVVGLALNILLAKLALALELPLFLDSIGTILVAALGGLLPGVIVGFFSNAINSVGDPITLYYGVVSVLIAVCAAFMSRRGFFRRPLMAAVAVLVFALLGGVIGSLITWMLYGLNIGQGISAPLAMYLWQNLGMSEFASQLAADFSIDILDKLVTVPLSLGLIYLIPARLRLRLPLGYVYGSENIPAPERGVVKLSLRHKITLLIALTALVVGVLSTVIGFIVYKRSSDVYHEDECSSAAEMMLTVLDGDEITRYAETLETDEEYELIRAKLGEIRASYPDVTYMYVVKVLEEGCLVVFDLDTDDVEASPLGEVWEHEAAFVPYRQTLLAGGEIEPVISNDAFGWLLTVYKPILDSEGNCAAYAAVDISMSNVRADRYEYIIRIISLLFGATMIIIAFTIWYAQKNIVTPIKALTDESNSFAFDTREREKTLSELRFTETAYRTGDEIEALSHALGKMAGDLGMYVAEINDKNTEITKLQDNIILSMADMVESRDGNTGEHVRRTAAYVEVVARRLRANGVYEKTLTNEYISDLCKSAPLHDIGKIKIPDAILLKPGKLSYEEYELMKTHTVEGRKIINHVLDGIEGDSYLSLASDMTLCHHEKWDGSGYPLGIEGEEIPLSARIMAIADVFDALNSKRCYKPPFSFDEAVAEIKRSSGSHFDPSVVDAFLQSIEQIKEIAERRFELTPD